MDLNTYKKLISDNRKANEKFIAASNKSKEACDTLSNAMYYPFEMFKDVAGKISREDVIDVSIGPVDSDGVVFDVRSMKFNVIDEKLINIYFYNETEFILKFAELVQILKTNEQVDLLYSELKRAVELYAK